MPKFQRFVLILIVCLGFVSLTSAQEDTATERGLIREGDDAYTSLLNLDPLQCDTDVCYRLTALLYPMFLGIDPETGYYSAGNEQNNGIVDSWSVSADGLTYTFQLRQDAVWNDGSPINAQTVYDSFFAAYAQGTSYADSLHFYVERVEIVDDTTLMIQLKAPNCDTLSRINFPILPPQYRATAEPSISSGSFQFLDALQGHYIRLIRGDLAYELTHVAHTEDAIDRFLRGELTYLTDIPYEEWADLSAHDDVRLYETPSLSWDTLIFNFSNPNKARSLRDRHGNLQEQFPHPIFSDLRVRQALQAAINPQEIMDIAFAGHGTIMASDQLPSSWALNQDLAPLGYNRQAAEQLLEEAGWRYDPTYTYRLCRACTTAPVDTPLYFTLSFDSNTNYHWIVAQVIRQQLERVGFQVDLNTNSGYQDARSQNFDVLLMNWTESYPITPDTLNRYAIEEDILSSGDNIGSYQNPELEAFLEQAQNVPNCDLAQRADLYAQAQVIFQQDLPNVWLYAYNDGLFVRNNVENVAPLPQAPFWNIAQWTVRN